MSQDGSVSARITVKKGDATQKEVVTTDGDRGTMVSPVDTGMVIMRQRGVGRIVEGPDGLQLVTPRGKVAVEGGDRASA